MGDCEETLRELEAFLDRELSEQTRHVVQAHLGGCVDCHQAFDFHAELKIVIARKCANDPLPPGLLARLESCLGTDLDGDGVVGDGLPR